MPGFFGEDDLEEGRQLHRLARGDVEREDEPVVVGLIDRQRQSGDKPAQSARAQGHRRRWQVAQGGGVARRHVRIVGIGADQRRDAPRAGGIRLGAARDDGDAGSLGKSESSSRPLPGLDRGCPPR